MNLFETNESQERLRRTFNEVRTSSSLSFSDLAKVHFNAPQWDDIRKIACGLVTYSDSPYASEISVEFSYEELVESGVELVALGYGKALAELGREIPKVKAAAKCLRRINGKPGLSEVIAVRNGASCGSHRVVDGRFLSDALTPIGKLSLDYCETPIDPRTGESETCPHGIRYRWER